MSNSTPTTAQSKISYLHGLRGIAAFTVVIGHCFQSALMNSMRIYSISSPAIFPWWMRIASQVAGLAVPTFIILSGYVLSLPIIRDGGASNSAWKWYWQYIERRANRILPAYWVSVIFGLLVAVLVSRETTWYALAGVQFWSTMGLMHDWISDRPDWNRPLWSMAIEWHIYFVAPFLWFAWRRFGVVRPSISAIAVCIAGIVLAQMHGFVWVRPEFYACFVVGAVAANVVHSTSPTAVLLRQFAHWKTVAVGMVVCFELWSLAVSGWDTAITHPMEYIIAWAVTMFVCMVALGEPSRARALLANRRVVALGTVSYSLYLLHWPVVDAVSTLLPKMDLRVETIIVLLVAVPISLIIASISYRFLEKPYLNRREKAQNKPLMSESSKCPPSSVTAIPETGTV